MLCKSSITKDLYQSLIKDESVIGDFSLWLYSTVCHALMSSESVSPIAMVSLLVFAFSKLTGFVGKSFLSSILTGFGHYLLIYSVKTACHLSLDCANFAVFF